MAVQALRFVAYDGDDPNGSPVGELTESAGKFFDIEYNGTGGGELQVSRHSTQAHWSDPGAYIRVYLDSITTCRGAFWVTQSNDEILGADEDGIEVYRRQGNGPLYYLSDGIVWFEAVTGNDSAVPLVNTDVWEWTGPVHPGGILVRMLEEAIVRGCYPDLTYDFSRTTDSNGDPWTITIEEVFQLQVGQNMLEVVAKLQELGLVLVMDHDLVLHAYESVANSYVGRNLAATVTLTKGADIVDSAERQQVSASARSSTLVKGTRSDNGEIAWVPADSAAALSELGRRKEGFLDAGDATHFETLELMGLNDIYRKLRLKAGPTAISVTDPTATAKRALIDYTVGDQITVDIPGVFNAVAKPITSIQIREREAVRDALHEDTGYSDYDVVVGFDEDPARLELPPDIVAGPAGAPDSPCCPDEGPFVPPPVDSECGLAAAVTLHIGSHAFFGDPSPPDHNFDYASIQGITATLTTGLQYRQLVTVAYNNPTTGSDSTMSGDPFIYLAYPTGGTPANPPGPNGGIIDAATWTWSVGGVADNGIDTASNGGFSGGYGTGATFDSGWKTFDGPDVVADIIARGIPVSGFHGFEAIYDVRIEVRNGDGSAIVCDDTQTAPHEGQTANEQAVGSGTTRFTNFPYIAGSLKVWVGGVLVSVTETDPTTGEFELPFDPGSAPVVVQYQSTGGAGTGAGNITPTPGTYPIPTELIVGFETYDGGGNPRVSDHGNLGSTETIDAADGNQQRGVLNMNSTITVSAFDDGGIVLWLYQDGTGGHSVTWSGVTFTGDDQPDTTASSVTPFILMSEDGVVYGFKAGGGSTIAELDDIPDVNAPSPSNGDVLTWDSTPGEWIAAAPSAAVSALDDLTDATITTPQENDTLRYRSGVWVNDDRRWEPVTFNFGAGPELVWDGDDLVMEWKAY